MSEQITAFKGFDENLQCRGFQYAEGETYEHDGPVVACGSGFHACEAPIDVLAYYPPASSRYHVVTLAGDLSRDGNDSKVAARRLTVGASIGIPGIVKAQVEYVTERAKPEKGGHATGTSGAASATGTSGAASATGTSGAASATGTSGAASATGYSGAASATGTSGAASATGTSGAASATGTSGAALASGTYGSANVEGEHSVAIATGYQGKAAGVLGCWIVLTERDDDFEIVAMESVKVGAKKHGIRIEAGVFYTLRGGRVVAA